MLKAVRKSHLSKGYNVFEGEVPVAYMRSYPNALREVLGNIQVGGDLYEVARDRDSNVLISTYLLRRHEKRTYIASATHNRTIIGPWSGALLLEYDGRVYTCKNPARGYFDIREEDYERILGSVEYHGMFSSEIVGDLPEEWPLEIQVFMLFLANLVRSWTRNAG